MQCGPPSVACDIIKLRCIVCLHSFLRNTKWSHCDLCLQWYLFSHGCLVPWLHFSAVCWPPHPPSHQFMGCQVHWLGRGKLHALCPGRAQ
ncbi:hypothetical protein ACRRTK_008279 [Alexandromys fortis]